jgi:hypothetical protein
MGLSDQQNAGKEADQPGQKPRLANGILRLVLFLVFVVDFDIHASLRSVKIALLYQKLSQKSTKNEIFLNKIGCKKGGKVIK